MHKDRLFPICIALIVYLLAAIYTLGYYNPDEHFQIFEFANFKLGKIPGSQLPWEYATQIRSSFQPWVAFLVIKWLHLLGSSDPYTAALLLRLITAVLAVYSIDRYSRSNMFQVNKWFHILFLWFSFLLWFLPFINVRFSSESWSGLCFLLAASHIRQEEENRRRDLILAGIFCGLAFLCRFQTGLMFGGLFFWLLLVKKEGAGKLALLAAAFAGIVLLGIVLDRLYYGKWTVAFINYFEVNIVEGVSSNFGTTNWYIYLLQVIFASVIPIGLLIFAAFIVLLVDSPKSLLICIVSPLLLVHLIIPHKEIRFLFPLANFVPLILLKGWQQFVSLWPKPLPFRRSALVVGCCLGVLNFIALLPSIFTVPANGRMAITKYFRDDFSRRPVRVYSLQAEEENPFQPYSFLRQSFYEMPNVQIYQLPKYNMLSRNMFGSDTLGFLVVHQGELMNPDLNNRIKELGLIRVKEGVAPWILAMQGAYDRSARDGAYVLYAKATP